MKTLVKSTTYFTIILSLVLSSCDTITEPQPVDPNDNQNPIDTTGNTTTPTLTGDLNAMFVGHSAFNFIVDDYVKLMTHEAMTGTTLEITEITNHGGLSLESKYDVSEIAALFDDGASSNYDFLVLTEQWDYQWYNTIEYGADSNDPVTDCPPADYQVPAIWLNPDNDWIPSPYALQRYTDAITCGNPDAITYYYQTWSLGYNEVNDGATRPSDQNYVRPTVEEIDQLQGSGQGFPDLPLADRIEFEGVKWENFVKNANRPNIVFIPAGYAVARLIREIEAGTVPGFEDLAETNGITASGNMAWADYIFYEDQYHASTVGHYFLSLVIYASVFNQSPEGLSIGSNRYLVSSAFSESQYPLEEITNERYQELLVESGAKGIYDLRGYNDLDYMHDDLRIHLQRLAWEVVQQDSDY
ncbi:hypothetical protein [Marinoscillum pacificum]|uniref:hypothetical protein n=1 Tax=Marinoscillum pacificum TaxID=392723 RepID=UPI0021573B33|nr:hypothetical protein [Marinoscillum pacificum]